MWPSCPALLAEESFVMLKSDMAAISHRSVMSDTARTKIANVMKERGGDEMDQAVVESLFLKLMAIKNGGEYLLTVSKAVSIAVHFVCTRDFSTEKTVATKLRSNDVTPEELDLDREEFDAMKTFMLHHSPSENLVATSDSTVGDRGESTSSSSSSSAAAAASPRQKQTEGLRSESASSLGKRASDGKTKITKCKPILPHVYEKDRKEHSIIASEGRSKKAHVCKSVFLRFLILVTWNALKV